MTYVSAAATNDLNEEMDQFVSPSITRSNRQAAAEQAGEGVTAAQLKNDSVSVLQDILDLYGGSESEDVAELLVVISEEHPQAVIKAGGVDIFRSEIYDAEKEIASTIDAWSLRGLQALAEEEPAQVLDDLPAIAQLLKLYSKNDKTNEREIYSLVRLLMAIGREYPDHILNVEPDAIESIIEVIETVETTITIISGLIALEEVASNIHAVTRKIGNFSDQLRPLLWHDNPDVRYQACRLAVHVDFGDINDRLNDLVSSKPIDTSSPTEGRIPLAAGRALAASRGDQETAERAARISRPIEEMERHSMSNEEILGAIGDPDWIIRLHAATVTTSKVWLSKNINYLADSFPELIRQQDDPVTEIREILTVAIVNIIDICEPQSDMCSLEGATDERFEQTLDNVIPILNAERHRSVYIGISLLQSVSKKRPSVANSWLQKPDTPSLQEIVDRSTDHQQLAYMTTKLLLKLVVAADPKLVAEQEKKIAEIVETLTTEVTGYQLIYKLIVVLVQTKAASAEILDQLVNPVAGLIRDENLCSYRLRGCWTLCYLAANLNDSAILPTVYDVIIDCWPTHLESDYTEAWRMLDGLKTIANHGFVPPDDIIERLIELTQSDIEIDTSSAQADTFGELAVITLGVIEDESIEAYLQDMQSDDDLPIETRRAVTRVLEER